MLRTLYSLSSEEEKELAKETISITEANNRYTFYFSTPSYDFTAKITTQQNNQSVKIIESTAYSITVELTGEMCIRDRTIAGPQGLMREL